MCGIIGISSRKDGIVKKILIALNIMQHRGKEGAGISIGNGESLIYEKGRGLVNAALPEEKLNNLAVVNGNVGIGHVRYSTAGSTNLECTQPIVAEFKGDKFALAHNGNLVNASKLREYCSKKGYNFCSDTDTEVIAALLSLSERKNFNDALVEVLPQIKGAFSLLILFKDKIYAARDSFGIRPLCVGKYDDGHIIASESLVIDKLSAKYFREIEPGELVTLSKSRAYYDKWIEKISLNFCVFEFIYFSFPQSFIIGRTVSSVREEMGCLLSEEHRLEADFVVAVPNSGKSAAFGYSSASGISLDTEAITRNPDMPKSIRSFITNGHDERRKLICQKFNINSKRIRGKKIIVIDDSVVRADVSAMLCGMLREAGAKRISWLAASPPYKYPCYYGIDTWRVKNELAAARHSGDIEKIRREIGADYLGYLSLDSTIKATGLPPQNFCAACFTGEYPIPPDR